MFPTQLPANPFGQHQTMAKSVKIQLLPVLLKYVKQKSFHMHKQIIKLLDFLCK